MVFEKKRAYPPLWEELVKKREEIEKKIGYQFVQVDLLLRAFVHRSFYHEHKKWLDRDNERLEFLGDAVLGLIIAEYLYQTFSDKKEGELSILHSRLVESGACCKYFEYLELQEYVLLGKGEEKMQRGKSTIFADVFEALIAAIYLDGGFQKAQAFVKNHLKKPLEERMIGPVRNFKAEIQEFAQKNYGEHPIYLVEKQEGPEHAKYFYVSVSFAGKCWGYGEGYSKKQAEQQAARQGLEKIKEGDPE